MSSSVQQTQEENRGLCSEREERGEEEQRVDVNKSVCQECVTETFPLHLHPEATRLFIFVVSSLLCGRGSRDRSRRGLKKGKLDRFPGEGSRSSCSVIMITVVID